MTMRLNLDSILHSQIRECAEAQKVYNRSSLPIQRETPCLRLGAGRSPVDNYFYSKPNVNSRVETMMANIHRHMKTTAPPRKAVPSVPAAISELPVPSKAGADKKLRRVKGGATAALASSKTAMMPIARMKAKINQQSQQVMRRGYVDMNPKNFTNQRRIREVLLHKSVLENMLLQHKRLQRDRQTIALDIQRMRQDLDKIKKKLDTSQEALKSTRTLYGGYNKVKKVGLVPLALPINAAAATLNAPSTRPTTATKPSIIKSGKIIAKRQHLPVQKKRRNRY